MSAKRILVMGYGGYFSGERNYLRNLAFEAMEKATIPLRNAGLYDFRCIELSGDGTFQEVYSLIHQEMENHRPEIVLIAGTRLSADAIYLEERAHNRYVERYSSFVVPQNSENKLLEEGASSYRTLLPLCRICCKLREDESLSVEIRHSTDAGGHGCNAALYAALHISNQLNHKAGITFVHIPFTREQADLIFEKTKETKPFVDSDVQIQAISRIIEVCAEVDF
ncbi:hypothetical protein [Shimazuella kribbensis]|uniref:pyroglutamyl-peptidase I family protein n=1 Tax=Shimazuella kribbensis TaxID=139808 RepID=UPI00048AEC09|nr:hypothetical protein [Shimazuella kribbensis]